MQLEIDNRTLDVSPGTTLLEAARMLNISIPTLCTWEGLDHATSCMVCVVEDCRTGKLLPACAAPAEDGMVIATTSPIALDARRAALELLLGDHLGDCEGPCRRACPAGMAIPAMLRLIAAGRMDEALRLIQRDIALPAVLGRICPAPCEKACRRGQHDAPVAICRLKRFAADQGLAQAASAPPHPGPPPGDRPSVAVVGAGPAGIAAAYALQRAGYAVTLYEKEPRAGGGLRHPALADSLPAAVLDAELAAVLTPGIDLRTGIEVGRDVSVDSLKARHAALILAPGAGIAAFTALPGLTTGPHGIHTERHTGRTGDPLVFACGNAVMPGHMAVRAEAQGHAAAVAVDQLLQGQPVTGIARSYDQHLGSMLDAEELGVFLDHASPDARREPEDRATGGYTRDEACAEAARCLRCDCRKPETCRLRQHAGASGARQRTWKPEQRRRVRLVRHHALLYEPGKCIACGICVRLAEQAREPLGLTFIGRGFDVRVGVPFDEPLDQGLQKVAAECIAACPTGALAAPDGDSAPPAGDPV